MLKLYLDDTALSAKLETYMTQLCALTEKLTLVKEESMDTEAADIQERPCVRICREDGSWTGLAFHGVPGDMSSRPLCWDSIMRRGRGRPWMKRLSGGYGRFRR